jgi:hypothetical protein
MPAEAGIQRVFVIRACAGITNVMPLCGRQRHDDSREECSGKDYLIHHDPNYSR